MSVVVCARRFRSEAGTINSGHHNIILAFTMRRVLGKRRAFDFVPSYLKSSVNEPQLLALFLSTYLQ